MPVTHSFTKWLREMSDSWTHVRTPLLVGGAIASTIMACTSPPVQTDAPPPALMLEDVAEPLSEAELTQWQIELQQRIQADLDMLGLGKLTSVAAPVPPELTEFRQAWAETDAAIAPFLGYWAQDWNMHPHDYMTVFPSMEPGHVCLVRYRKDMTDTVPFQEITTPIEVSIAQVIDGQLLGTHTKSGRSLLLPTPALAYLPYEAEFLGTVEPNGTLRLYAAQQPPTVDPTWDSRIQQQLDVQGCTSQLPEPSQRL